MQKAALLFSIFLSVFSFSQIKFEKGYFLTNEEQRVEALIKNVDWKNNPTTFTYKLHEGDDVKTGNVNTIRQFEIYGQSKYISAAVNIDRSTNSLANMSLSREPEYKLEKLFLKQIVTGAASLYSYADGNINRFFFQVKEGAIEQLVSKPFKLDEQTMGYNNDYKNQLRKKLLCEKINSREIENTAYQSRPLENLFLKYNQCNNPDYVELKEKTSYGKINLNIRPRLNFINVQINSGNSYYEDYGTKASFGAGIEAEYILPFNKDKWAIIIEPTYQNFQAEIETEPFPSLGKRKHEITYQSIQLPFGIRHYLFLNDHSRTFLNAQYVLDIPIKGKQETNLNSGVLYRSLDLTAKPNFTFGVGYNYLQKYGVEFRYFTKNEITTTYLNIPSEMNTISVILSYTFFKSH